MKRSTLLATLILASCSTPSAPADESTPLDAGENRVDADAQAFDGARDIGSMDAQGDMDAAVEGAWRLPDSVRAEGRLPMEPLYPRPNDETSPNAYHRRAHPRVPYRVRLAVQGGAWPFRYELVEGPPGATIASGELLRSRDETGRTLHETPMDYGVVNWTPTQGTHSFRARVTDQQGEQVEFTWTTVTDASSFVFVDAQNGNDDAAGTFEAPLQSFAAGLWRNDDDDDAFAQRIAVFREGRYEVFAEGAGSSPILDGANKPIALIALHGENVTFDMTRGHFRTGAGGLDDYLVAGIDFVGARSDLGNNRIFNITRRSERVTFWNVSFDATHPGTVGTDNPACIAFMADGPYHRYLAVLDSRLNAGAASQLVVTFDSDYVLFEGNVAEGVDLPGSNGSFFLHAKDDTNHLTIRDNAFVGSTSSSAIDVTNQLTLGSASDQEVCWNRVAYEGARNVDSAIVYNSSTTTADAMNTHVYRNSVATRQRAFRFYTGGGPIPVRFEANAFLGEVFGDNFVLGELANAELGEGDFDADARLRGDARASLTQVGAEILVPSE